MPHPISPNCYTGGGMKRHITSHVPNSFCRMHTYIRPSFETRTGKSRGTTAVPCLDVTTNCGGTLPVGIKRQKATTGAQSLSLQHSFGYQLCAGVGQVPKSIELTIRANRCLVMLDTATSSSRHRFTRSEPARHIFI